MRAFANLSPPVESAETHHDHLHRPSLLEQGVNLAFVALPPVALVVAMVLLWGWGFSWFHLCMMTVLYLITGFGITIGYHRYFTHLSFTAPRWVVWTLAILGSMAAEGPLLRWVATHRKHHQHSDKPDDPHSPHQHPEGVIGALQGFWHAHIGWLFGAGAPGMHRYVADLMRDRSLVVISNLFPLWVILGLVIPTVLAGVVTQSWSGALLGFLWGGLIRIMVVHHITWSINSVCHIWGSQPFRSHDHSRNNLLFGVLGLGEGWHNNHHAFPTSARHGLHWWQIDFSYWIIRTMEILGIVSAVKVPSEETMAAKLKTARPTGAAAETTQEGEPASPTIASVASRSPVA